VSTVGIASSVLAAPPGWPTPPRIEAFSGLVGEIVDVIEPSTEADPVAILAQLLVACGSVIGRGAYFQVEATRHHPAEFLVLVGDSAKARKGSSWDHVARLVGDVDPGFTARCSTGLSSGEGLIWALRDRTDKDHGADDPRLLVVEPEFASVLKATARDISTLSPVLRSAWDGRPLAILTRTAPARASAAHLSVIGHITAAELRHHVSSIEVEDCLLNRFLFLACRRARLLPEGGDPDPLAGTGLGERLAANLASVRRLGEVRFSDEARRVWFELYEELSAPVGGLAGALAARSEAHVVRLSLLYALSDGEGVIARCHLLAGLALFDYAQRSAAWAMEGTAQDPVAEELHAALVAADRCGLTRTEIRDMFQRNRPTRAIEDALRALQRSNRATLERVTTGGRPAEVWFATAPAADGPARGSS
jgi:hypothetical protein